MLKPLTLAALLATPAAASPTDGGECGTYGAFLAAIVAEGYTRWPGYRFARVDGVPKRAEIWFQPIREEWRVAVDDQIADLRRRIALLEQERR